MWLFTQHGFYSVVEDSTNPSFVFIRARSREHLEALRRFGIRVDGIRFTPRNDYPYRLRLLKDPTWEMLARALARDVTYPNFKDTIHKDPRHKGTAYDALLMPVWELARKKFEADEIIDSLPLFDPADVPRKKQPRHARPPRRRRNKKAKKLLAWLGGQP